MDEEIYPFEKRIADLKTAIELVEEAHASDNKELTIKKAKFLAKASGWLVRALRQDASDEAIMLDAL
jgi:hypothetical protein